MLDFISEAGSPLNIYWIIALVSSVLFVLMTVLSFFGADADVDTDVDGADGGPGLFSFKSLVNFLFAYGWATVLLYPHFNSLWALNVVAILVGIGFILLVFGGLTLMLKLAKDSSFRVESTLGKSANVYLRIPGRRGGSGNLQHLFLFQPVGEAVVCRHRGGSGKCAADELESQVGVGERNLFFFPRTRTLNSNFLQCRTFEVAE